MSAYCEFAINHPVHGPYHDTEYGFPVESDKVLFERLVLEINQAGLSWELILKKREGFRKAYAGFDIDRVAAFDENDRVRLLNDASIIRNRLKINAAIENARKLVELSEDFGSFSGWLDAHQSLSKEEWVKLFRANFKFTGEEIVAEFLMSTGYLPGAHKSSCPVYDAILERSPPWVKSAK